MRTDPLSVMLREYGRYVLDDVRTDAYERAIAATVRPGDVVVDLGSGFGLLAMLAARHGAGHVYAIEQLPLADAARELARANGVDTLITFITERACDVRADIRADVILTELFGQFGVDELLAENLTDARRRFGPRARTVPMSCQLLVAAASLPGRRSDLAGRFAHRRWSDVAGLDVSKLRQQVVEAEVLPYVVHRWSPGDELLGPAAVIHHQDFGAANVTSCFAAEVEISIERDGVLDGVVGFMRAELAAGVALSTAPGEPSTHWHQVIFSIVPPRAVHASDVLRVRIGFDARDGWSYVPDADRDQPRTKSGPTVFADVTRRTGEPVSSVSSEPDRA